MSSQQLNDLGPKELFKHARNILNSATVAYALATAVASEAIAAVFREKVTMANRRSARRWRSIPGARGERRARRNVVTALEIEEAYYRAAAVRARTKADIVKAAAEEAEAEAEEELSTTENERRVALHLISEIFTRLNNLEWGTLLDASELAQAPNFNINKLIDDATDAFARLKMVDVKREFAQNAYDAARQSVQWVFWAEARAAEAARGRYSPISPSTTARVNKAIKEYRAKALIMSDILHREQFMGEWSDELIESEVAKRIDEAGKLIKRHTSKNRKKTKRRKQKIAKRIKGTKRR